MSIENVKKFLDSAGLLDRYIELSGSTATVELAAQQLNCEQARIAKSMAMLLKNGDAIVIVTNGTAKINNSKYKAFFKEKAHFCPSDQLIELIGHPMGGVSPFGLKQGVKLFLDVSLKRFDLIYPAAGAANNAVRITPGELQRLTGAQWIDVTKDS